MNILNAITSKGRTVLLVITGIALAVLYTLVRNSGAQSAKLEQLRDWSKYQKQRNKDAQAIQRMPDSDVRERLRKRWTL